MSAPPLERPILGPRNPLWQYQSTVLVLVALSLFLLALPLAIGKPGLPVNLKADEAAYLGMAESLANDFDLRFDEVDTVRLFEDFPFRWKRNLILMSTDGWQSTHFGKPYPYSLAAAPAVRLLGANGMLLLNVVLFLAMIWMGALYLSRWLSPPVAAVFSVGFFFVSALWTYVFWLQPEIWNAFLITLAMFLGFERLPEETRHAWAFSLGSGAALGVAAWGKPMYAGLALVLVGAPLLARRVRAAGWVVGGVVLGLLVTSLVCLVLTGRLSPYLEPHRGGVTVCAPGEMPPEVAAWRGDTRQEVAALATDSAPEATPQNAFTWLARIPRVHPTALAENVVYFLIGRHAGFVPYFPFAALAVVLFLFYGRRSRPHLLLLFSLVVVAFWFLLFIDWNWQGGGGFVGNRYFVSVVPAFLFLVTAVRARLLPIAFGVGGLLLGPLLLTPLGVLVPEPTLQAHARGFPLRHLPLELSLRNMPGYHTVKFGEGLRLRAQKDVVVPLGEELWVEASAPVELIFLSPQKLPVFMFEVQSAAPSNRIRLSMDDATHELDMERTGQGAWVRFEPRGRRRLREGHSEWVYRLTVHASRGALRDWERHYPPRRCSTFAEPESETLTFMQGARLIWLGDGSMVEGDPFFAEVAVRSSPYAVSPGEAFEVPVTVRNNSEVVWSPAPSTRVKLGYQWLAGDGTSLGRGNHRTELPGPVAPGDAVEVAVRVDAPVATVGSLVLEIEPVLEYVAWFGDRREGNVAAVEVAVAETSPRP